MDNVEDIYPLTPLQAGILAHVLKAPDTSAYHVQFSCTLTQADEAFIETLVERWNAVMRHEAVLRTSIVWEELDEPVQVVQREIALPWQVFDWRAEPASCREDLWREVLARDLADRFDLAGAPLFRLYFCRVDDDCCRFLWSYHHIILDGWSSLVLLRATLRDTRYEPSPTRFRDYVAWQRQQDPARCEAYWRSVLGSFSDPARIRIMPGVDYGNGSQTLTHRFTPAESNRITGSIEAHRFTVNTLVMGAWALCLGYLTGSEDVVFGASVAGRSAALPRVSDAVGLFLNTLPVRARLRPEQTVLPWLSELQTQLLASQGFSHAALSDIQRETSVPTDETLFDSIVVGHWFPDHPELARVEYPEYRDHSEFPLAILHDQSPAGISCRLIAAPRMAAIAPLILDLLGQSILGLASATEATRLIDVVLSPASLSRTVRSEPDPSSRDSVSSSLVPDRIARQCQERGLFDAVIAGDMRLSYAQLQQDSDLLAVRLNAAGVTRQAPVGLWLPANHRIVVAMLAVWKCGGCFVPIHPDTPLARVRYLLREARCTALIAEEPQPEIELPVVVPERQYADEPVFGNVPFVAPQNDDPAYIMFTSGSTGVPKGVVVSHANLAYSTGARLAYYRLQPARFLLLSPPAFDSAMAGLFWTLCCGGSLVIASETARRDLDEVIRLIRLHGITHTLCIPTLYAALLDFASSDDLAGLRCVIVAGEACPQVLVGSHAALAPQAELYNEYGPTEATVWSTVAPLYRSSTSGTGSPEAVNIGRAIPGTRVHLLDGWQRQVPAGIPGEIWISGPGVAQGYLGIDGGFHETLMNPQMRELSGRCYQTGDRAYVDSEGRLHFLGRQDRQVKVNGHRIDLSEVEGVVQSCTGVVEAAIFEEVAGIVDDDDPGILADLVMSSPHGLAALIDVESQSDANGDAAPPIREIRRTGDGYTLLLRLANDYVRPPRDSQRAWLTRQMMDEFAEDLEHLARVSKDFVPGQESRIRENYPNIEHARLSAEEVMEEWQQPLMRAMASLAVERGDDVLEIGFGRGYAASAIQELKPASHTMIESNPAMIETYYPAFLTQHRDARLEMLEGRWQTWVPELGRFDSILFHAFPLNEEEFIEHVLSSITYAEHAFPELSRHLKPGGRFTYLTTEIDSLSRRHQRLLFRYFDQVTTQVMPTRVPSNTGDAWWAGSMVVLVARRAG